MVDSAPRLQPSYSADVILPSLLRTSVQTAEPVVQRNTPVQGGLLAQGSRGRILNSSPPNPAWVAPEDLHKPFKPSKLVEDSLAFYRAQHADSGISTELQRALLEEACSPDEFQAYARLKGNRLAAIDVNGTILAAHPIGQAGETLCLSVLARSSDGRYQGRSQSHIEAAGSPILQLVWSQPQRSQDRLLVVCRTSHWICVYEASSTKAREPSSFGSGEVGVSWILKPAAAIQTSVRVSHMALNSRLPSQMGFVCEDGSVHMVDANSQLGAARQISLGGSTFPVMQSHVLDSAGKETGHQKQARLVCEWGVHPMTLLLAAGAQLLRYDIRKPGANCVSRPIHVLPKGDAFVALAPMHHATSALYGRQPWHLLAASTLDCVLLLDLRRPSQALLKWPHRHRREPPQLLSMYCAGEAKEDQINSEAHSPLRSPHRQNGLLDSTLHGSASGAEHDTQAGAQPDVFASQYGSNTQPQGSLPRQMKSEQFPGIFGTQASQASPTRVRRRPMQRADAANPWPVSWHAEAAEQDQSSSVPELPGRAAVNVRENGVQGRICAASMGFGDVLLYSFACSGPETEVHAMAPAGSQAGATSEANQSLGGSIKVTPVMPAQQCASQPGQPRPDDGHVAISNRADRRSSEKKGHHSEGAAAINDSAGCTWRPAGMTATYAQGLPRRICWPLKAAESTDAGLEGLAPEVAQQLEEMHVEGPDLCGVAVLPAPAPPGRSCASLMRLGFLGHVSAEHFADPIAAPSHHEEHCQAALYNIVLTSTKSSQAAAAHQSRQRKDNRVKQGQRLKPAEWTEDNLLCNMSGHHAIALAALQVAATQSNRAAEVSAQVKMGLQSLLGDMQVPLSLWEISQELGNMGTEQLSGEDDLGVYRKRVGSALKGAPVIDYTSEGTRASRMQRWDKLRNDRDGLAATRYQQALSGARSGDGTFFSDLTCLRSAVAALAAAAGNQNSADELSVKLGQGLSIPHRSSLADAKNAQRTASASQLSQDPLQGSQQSSLVATLSQASPPFNHTPFPHVAVERSSGTGDIVSPVSHGRLKNAEGSGSPAAQMIIQMKMPEVTDEAAKKALKEMEEDWNELEGQLLGQSPSEAPAQPPGQVARTVGPSKTPAAEQKGLSRGKRPGGPLASQLKSKRSTASSRASMQFEEGFS